MPKSLFLFGFCVTSCAFALPTLSGTVQDAAKGPIDVAQITVFDATGKGIQTSSSMGNFSLSGVPEGEYLVKVESTGRMPVLGSIHLAGDGPHRINVVMLNTTPQQADAVGAGSAFRDAVRPPRTSSKLPKVKPAQVIKKITPVYPATERKAGVRGTVRIAMIILPNGTLDDLVVLSAPDDNLAFAALVAVRLWQYSPTSLDDQTVEASLTVEVNFER
jgi:TonB family protein